MSDNFFNIKDDWLYIPSSKGTPVVNNYPIHGYSTSLSDALIAQAKCIYNDFKDRRIVISLSGGIDSQQAAYGFAKANLPVKYVHFNFTFENRPEKERIFIDEFAKKFNIDVDIIDYNFSKQSLKDFLIQIKYLSNIGYHLMKKSHSDYLKIYPDTMFVQGDQWFDFLRSGNVCYGSLNLHPGSFPLTKFHNSMLEFFYYSTHLYEYFEYLHRKDKILQFHKRFHPKNLAYTELGFHLREKLGNCNWHTNSFHTYPTMTSIDFANQRSFLAQQKDRRYWFLKEIFNYSNEQTDYLIKKFRTNEKLNYNGFSYINLYSFETDVARYDL